MTQQVVINNTRYTIIKELKKGGMGIIYLATDTLLEKNCVIKKLDLNNFPVNEHANLEKSFQREAKILAKLEHPGLPRVTDFFTDQSGWHLVMDYIEGEDLAEIRQQREISEKEIVKWSLEILDVLDYLHNQNPKIIYRDLKPSNVMLDKTGKIKVIDFGIARKIEAESNTKKLANQQTTIGTVGYAPWEQYAGKADTYSDLYSLGVTMHFLLTNIDPVTINIQSIAKVRPQTNQILAELIMKATDSRIDVRFQSASEMKVALQYVDNGKMTQIQKCSNNNDYVLDMIQYLGQANISSHPFLSEKNDIAIEIDEMLNLYQRTGTKEIGLKKFEKLMKKDLKKFLKLNIKLESDKKEWINILHKKANLSEYYYKKPKVALKIYNEILEIRPEDWVYDNISRLNLVITQAKRDYWKKWSEKPNNLLTSTTNFLKKYIFSPFIPVLIFAYIFFCYPCLYNLGKIAFDNNFRLFSISFAAIPVWIYIYYKFYIKDYEYIVNHVHYQNGKEYYPAYNWIIFFSLVIYLLLIYLQQLIFD
jgi:serine/threonine protein kinase